MNMNIGMEVMLNYLQHWGQSAEQRIATLNKAVKAAGLRAEFRQANGSAGWHGPDCDKAVEFRRRLNDVWCGDVNAEANAVEAIIAEFAKLSFKE